MFRIYRLTKKKFIITKVPVLYSVKNSVLLFIHILGYRPFCVRLASPANYYIFLGDIQKGQGIILEDEADNIGKSVDKKNILKTDIRVV